MFELAIHGGTLYSGLGDAPYRASPYVSGGRIAAISAGEPLPAARVLDASGLAVAPGFIDIHTHSDNVPQTAPRFESALLQGVTTHIAGNCGSSSVPRGGCFPFKKGFRSVEGVDSVPTQEQRYAGHLPLNLGTLIGHGALRYCAMEQASEPIPTAAELADMCARLDECLCAGAFGLSLGLTYIPGTYSRTEELIALAKVVAKHGRILSVHMRSEGNEIWQALAEMRRVGLESGARLEISHLKLFGAPVHGQTARLRETLDEMRAAGVELRADQYPYTASSTGMRTFIPQAIKRSSNAELTAALADDVFFAGVKDEVAQGMVGRGGPDCIQIASTDGLVAEADGLTLTQLGTLWGVDPYEAYRRLMIASPSATGIFHAMREPDVLAIMGWDFVCCGSDGAAYDLVSGAPGACPHPRSMGAFARTLRLCREHHILPLEKAVRKLSGLTAETLRLSDRGVLRAGAVADVTLFDPLTITDRATFTQPYQAAQGIHTVLVSGVEAVSEGKVTGSLSGEYLRQK